MNIDLITDNILWNICRSSKHLGDPSVKIFYLNNDKDKLEKVLKGLEKKLKVVKPNQSRRQGQVITIWPPNYSMIYCMTYEMLSFFNHPPTPDLVITEGVPGDDDWNKLSPIIPERTPLIVINSKKGMKPEKPEE